MRRHVLVVGDVMLDEYVHGEATRVSPEAPVVVLRETHRTYALGGAANVAANVAGLGATVELIGVVGNDPEAEKIETMYADIFGMKKNLVYLEGRPTTRKTRLVAKGTQISRFDREVTTPLDGGEVDRVVETISMASRPDVIVVSDYDKGVVDDDVLAAIFQTAGSSIPVIVDPKRKDWTMYGGASIITPNEREWWAAKNVPEDAHLLVTRGAAGMELFSPGRLVDGTRISAMAREVFDVVGAGDTVVAALAVAKARGHSWAEASVFAAECAAAAVSHHGTTVVTPALLDLFKRKTR